MPCSSRFSAATISRAEGLKAGMIAHLDSVEHCIRQAVDSAERMAGVTVEDVHRRRHQRPHQERELLGERGTRLPAPCARRT